MVHVFRPETAVSCSLIMILTAPHRVLHESCMIPSSLGCKKLKSIWIFLCIIHYLRSRKVKSVFSHTVSGAICIIILLATHGVHADSQSKRIDQYLQSVLKVTPDTEFIDVYLVVKYHLSYDQLRSSTSGLSRKERQRAVVSILKNHAANTQSDVLAHLQRARAQGLVNNIQVIWAINVIAFMAMPSVIYDLARNFDKYREDLLRSPVS